MAVTYKLSAIPASFASCSFLSPKGGNLADRMRALHKAGFDGMELSMPDLLSYGAVLEGRQLDDTDENVILKTALRVRKLAADLGLKLVMLQPFARFEGWPKHSVERRDAFDRAERWLKVMTAVGTDMLQVGSSDAEGISSDFDELATDLAELADLAVSIPFQSALS